MSKAETAYRTIAEVSDLIQVQPSVLRFWETQFHQVKPTKRMGRRYYKAEDVVLLARIRDLLYKEGFTIKGVQKKLREKIENTDSTEKSQSVTCPKIKTDATEKLIKELLSIQSDLKVFID